MTQSGGVTLMRWLAIANLFKRIEKALAGALAPGAAHGSLSIGIHRPVAGEPPEVVDASLIVHGENSAKALRPPFEALLLVLLHRCAAPLLLMSTESPVRGSESACANAAAALMIHS